MVIAEIGINHNGELSIAKKLIAMAKTAGADVVKFQKRTPEICIPDHYKSKQKMTPWGNMSYLAYKKRLEFEAKEYDEINQYCSALKIPWTASVWDCISLDFIMQYDVPFIKIPSPCITDRELLQEAKKTSKPIIMSTGMSSQAEVDYAVSILKDVQELSLLHCNSSYPSRDDELDLQNILFLKSRYPQCRIGYSGHERGIMPSVIARVLGAEIIERHITLDKKMWGTDHAASLEYEELKQLTEILIKLPIWMGSMGLRIYESENKLKSKLRKIANTLPDMVKLA